MTIFYGGKLMEIRLINTSDTKNFVEFYKKLLGENKFLLPTSQEADRKSVV